MKNQGGVDESGIQSKRLKKIVNKMSSFSADSGALSAQLQQEPVSYTHLTLPTKA